MKIYKFIIQSNDLRVDPDIPGIGHSGRLAIVVASDEKSALAALKKFADEDPTCSPGWLRAAVVMSLPIEEGQVVTWVEM